MAATRDARTAKRKLAELGITSATVLTGSTTITIDLAAFDELVRWHRRYVEQSVTGLRFGTGVNQPLSATEKMQRLTQ